MDRPPTIRLLGIDLHALDAPAVVECIDRAMDRAEGGWVLTPNLDILRRLVRDDAFRHLCEGVTLRVADGMPLVWASRLLGAGLPERVAGSDLIWLLSERAARSGRSVFFLGGAPGTARQAADVLTARYPGLRVAGTECPELGFEHDETYLRRLEQRLAAIAPDVVYVALGSPKQEILIDRLRPLLPAAWFLGIGISFSFVCGDVERAPRWVRRLGLEWAHRLAQEPRRLARRYLVDGLPFAAWLLASSAWRGLVPGAGGDRTLAGHVEPSGEAGGYRRAG